jgi:hypothetical protein|tara:strand:- start:68 stop:205 length:138 start_codon:yes stop_codon:yes gene_type:complete
MLIALIANQLKRLSRSTKKVAIATTAIELSINQKKFTWKKMKKKN